MANTQGMQTVSLKAVTAIAATAEWYIVKLDTANDDSVLLAAANTDALYGIIASKPTNTANEYLAIAVSGMAKVMLGGTVARGDYLTADSAGKGVKITIAQTTVAYTIGQALESGASGEIVAVQLRAAAVEK